jgi:hypothetical protein
MKSKINILIISLFSIVCIQGFSQQIKLVSGNMSFLKKEKGLRLEFDYDSMRVGDYAREQDYVNQKVADYNKENPGSGENWLKAWRNNRLNLFQPAFRKNMNALIKPLSMNTNYDSTNYTLIVQTVFTEPGFYATSMVRKRASINLVFLFVDTQDHSRVLAKLTCNKVTTGYLPLAQRYDVANRLISAYGIAGTLLGTYLAPLRK